MPSLLIKTLIVLVLIQITHASNMFNWSDDNGNTFTVSDAPFQVFNTNPVNQYTYVRKEDGKTYYIASSTELKSEKDFNNVIEKYFQQKEKLQIQMDNLQDNMVHMGENIRSNVQQQMETMSNNLKNIFGKGFPFNKK